MHTVSALVQESTGSDVYFYTKSGYIVRMDSSYSRVNRGYSGTVITGTDGHLYLWGYVYTGFAWNAALRPITGDSYAAFWKLIPDDINDGPLTGWGIGTAIDATGSLCDHLVVGDYIYTLVWTSPYVTIAKLNRTTFAVAAVNNGLSNFPYTLHYYSNKIYTAGGVGEGSTLYKLNAGTLTSEGSMALNHGRLSKIVSAGGYIIVGNSAYTGTAGLYRIDPDTLAILGYIEFPEGEGCQALLALNDQFVVVGWNGGMTVYDITTMSRVSRIVTTGNVPVIGMYMHNCLACIDNSTYA
jgi:hypothetical protein